MTDPTIDLAASVDPHADKYNDPRAKITRRGIWMGIGVAVFGVVGAAASVYGRRTHLTETTRFWGQETITALQLAERMEMLPRRGKDFRPVLLTATPGLGHLRRAILDDRNYDWKTVGSEAVLANSTGAVVPPVEPEGGLCVMLRLTDPSAHRVGTIEIDIDLEEGWIGPRGEKRRVHVTNRKALRNFLETIMNRQIKRYDQRKNRR